MGARNRVRRAAGAGLAAGLFFLMVAPALGADAVYAVVALRQASGVASTGGPAPDPLAKLFGTTVTLGKTLTWLGGRTCGKWRRRPLETPPLDVADPNLSDLQLAPHAHLRPAFDKRRNRGVEIRCNGKPFAVFLEVDDKVLVVPAANGATHLILERVPKNSNFGGIKASLAALGLYRGPLDEAMNQEARRAVATNAESAGAAYRFANGVLTENLERAIHTASRLAIDPINGLIEAAIKDGSSAKGPARAEALSAVAVAVAKAGDPIRARHIAHEHLKTENLPKDALTRLLSWSRIAVVWHWAGEAKAAGDILANVAAHAARIKSPIVRSMVLQGIVRAQVETAQPAAAATTLTAIAKGGAPAPVSRASADVAAAYAGIGKGKAAVEVAGAIPDPLWRAIGLGRAAAAIGRYTVDKQGPKGLADPFFNNAGTPANIALNGAGMTASNITDPAARARAALVIATALGEAGFSIEAGDFLALADRALALQKKPAGALNHVHALALARVARAEVREMKGKEATARLEKAAALVPAIKKPERRAPVLAAIAAAHRWNVEYDAAERAFKEATTAARAVPDPDNRAKALAAVVAESGMAH